jgi:hypothetical protein
LPSTEENAHALQWQDNPWASALTVRPISDCARHGMCYFLLTCGPERLPEPLWEESNMRRTLTLILIIYSLVLVGSAFAAEGNQLDLKVGDKLYVCGCGKQCDCDTMAMKPGKCVCGKPMVKGTVTKVGEGTAVIKTKKGEQTFKTVGLYSCACGKGCNCGTISQKPGKCVCGKPMKQAEAL